MTKTPEEKAREEAETMISEYANNSHISREYYAEGYLSGYHSRDEEVEAYREALREIVKQVPRCNFNLSTSISYSEANRLDELIAKAKQLLKED